MSIIAEAFVSKLLDGLAALVKDEVAMILGVKGEIERLRKTLRKIEAVLADAERKKIQSKATDEWLKDLKDVMYDADDILDECRIEAEKSKAAVSSGHQPCSCLFSCSCFGKMLFSHQIGRRIKGLNHKLDDVWADKSKLGLQLSFADPGDRRSTSGVGRKTSPVADPDIVGSNIEKDTDKLVDLLLTEDTRESILVHAIVGIGGIGKTTLARRIFNDARITSNFQMKLWVCVSKDFEETSLLKEIITQAEPEGDRGGAFSRALLEPKVGNAVTNKKFLLVLDDMWDSKVWNDFLRKPLQNGAIGSRVLVTTRNQGVALQMKAVRPLHQVEVLSAEDGWALLLKKVVLSGEEGEIEHLQDIGEKIVEKCGGLPLAIKTIGGVLSTKGRTETEWERVLKTLSSNPWSSLTDFPGEVQPALWLSYEDLPSHLKQCFLYCSLFPEDYEFHRDELIDFWISEGFIHEEGDLTLEELGEGYYWELVQRSFLQPTPWSDDENPECTVHDILWSLARFLARDDNLVVKDGVEVPINSSSLKPRRLRSRVTKENRQAFIGALEGYKFLRTLLLDLEGSQVEENDVDNLIKKTPRLRVLELSNTPIIKLPDSLGNLIHLRYLYLSFSPISELPESIGNLVNLQFLILRCCDNLRSLPKGIGKLHNLRFLFLYETQLEGMPIEIGNLHRLRWLLVSYGDNCPQLPPLGNLPNLDYLWIQAPTVKKVGTEFLGREQIFPKLTALAFVEMFNWEEWEWEVKDDDRLIALPKLKQLTLFLCPELRSLPSGLVHHATTLTKLKIEDCVSLKAIRGFSSVEELEISDSCNLESVSDLPKLKTLKLEDNEMRSLPEWLHGGQPDFPALSKLEIMASDELLRRCLKDGPDWPKIEHIPYVNAKEYGGSGYISKSPSAFSTNLND